MWELNPETKDDWIDTCAGHVIHHWPLNENSIVFVAGAYRGFVVKFIVEKYNAMVYGFDPQDDMLDVIREMNLPRDKVKLFDFALGVEDIEHLPMAHKGTDACSFVFDPKESVTGYGRVRKIDTVLEENAIDRVDLLHLNCEGYELILLPYLVQTKLIYRFENLMVQFHHCEQNGIDLCNKVIDMVNAAGYFCNCNISPTWVSWNRDRGQRVYPNMQGRGMIA